MKSMIAIRTNGWGPDEERLAAQLKQCDGMDVVVVFHNRGEAIVPDLPVADIDNDWVANAGLVDNPDWGWRCGDYFYYRLREVFPDYDYYWLIEPDVAITGDAELFFKSFDTADADLLGYKPGVFNRQDHPYAGHLTGKTLHRSIFALTRMSGRTVDFLKAVRVEMSKRSVNWRNYTNDELFTFTIIAHQDGYTTRGLEEFAPDWFEGSIFDTDPDILIDAIDDLGSMKNKVFHPVKNREAFKEVVAARILNRSMQLMRKFRLSTPQLSHDDIEEISDNVRDQLVARLSP